MVRLNVIRAEYFVVQRAENCAQISKLLTSVKCSNLENNYLIRPTRRSMRRKIPRNIASSPRKIKIAAAAENGNNKCCMHVTNAAELDKVSNPNKHGRISNPCPIRYEQDL